jgi:hypothetical protein
MSTPSSVTVPSFQSSSAAMQFSSVDLPTPDSPTMATNSPGATLSETLANTGRVAVALGEVADDEAHGRARCATS